MVSAITLQKIREKSDQNSKPAKGSRKSSSFSKRKREPKIQRDVTNTMRPA